MLANEKRSRARQARQDKALIRRYTNACTCKLISSQKCKRCALKFTY